MENDAPTDVTAEPTQEGTPQPEAATSDEPRQSPGPADNKSRRIHLINRRSAAWLFEVTAVQLLIVPIFLALFVHLTGDVGQGFFLVQMLIWIPYILLRDLIGLESWGKRLVGLELRSNDERPLTAGRKVLRNVPLAIPIFQLIEFFAAYKGKDPKMLRFGDRWAKTSVAAKDPSTIKGHYQGILIVAMLVMGAAQFYATPKIANFYYAKFQGVPTSDSDAPTQTVTSPLGYAIELPETLKKNSREPKGLAIEDTLYQGGDGNLLLLVSETKVEPRSRGGVNDLMNELVKSLSSPPFLDTKHTKSEEGGQPVISWSALKKEGDKTYAVRGKILFTQGKRFYRSMGGWRRNAQEPSWIAKALESFSLTSPPTE
jgi:uncharacterized RDD family membrane protein YckC